MTRDHAPLVSIVTPAYNAAHYLDDLLQSVAAQDYPHIEHIVIDDGSTDDGATRRLLEQRQNVRWWTRENRGQYATLNEGFRAARGEFVTAISADDTYVDAGAVGALARGLIEHPRCEVAYGTTLHVDEQRQPLPVQPYQAYPPWMLRYNLGFIFHCSLLVRREPLLRDGLLFDGSYRYVGDADWMLRLSQRYRFRRVARPIGAYRHHGDQASTVANQDQAAGLRRLHEHNRLHRTYGTNRVIKSLVQTYDTFHQRRVKALAAWRVGGSRQVLTLTSGWLDRKFGRRQP